MLIAAIFVASCLLMVLLLVLVAIQLRFGLQGWLSDLGKFVVRLLASPGNNSIGQIFAIPIAVVPSVVGVVCFKVEQTPEGLRATSRPNLLGNICVVILLIGVLACTAFLVWFNADSPLFDQIVREKEVTAMLAPVATGILSFHLIYALKLLGWESLSGNAN